MSSQGGDHNIHFFKVILENNLRDGELRVPKSFVKKYWQEMSNPVSLKLPNSSTEWKVYWMPRDGDVWFRNGWKKFANHLSLKVPQFLVFEYVEKSLFKVIVLSESGLEIKYPLLKEGEAVDESDCSVKICEKFPFEGKRLSFLSPSSRTRKKMKVNPKEEPGCYSNHAETKDEKNKFHEGSVPKNSGDLKLIDDESKALFEDVKKSFTSENHFFLCRMQKTYAERDLMIIPKDFWNTLQFKEGNATLSVNEERPWGVKIKKQSSHGQLAFCDGWKKFFQDNNLKFGDVCAFVLHNFKGFSFRVKIFRLGEKPFFEEYTN